MNACAAGNREAIEDFVAEAFDSLQGLSNQLESFRLDPNDSEPINAVFRAIHSMKGCAAFLELDVIKSFSHSIENTLDDIRNGSIILCEALQQAIIESFDILEGLLYEAANGNIVRSLDSMQEELLERIEALAKSSSTRRQPDDILLECMVELATVMENHKMSEAQEWGRQLQVMVDEYLAASGTLKSDEAEGATTSENDDIVTTDLADGQFFCGNEDVTSQVVSLLEIFKLHAVGQYDESVGKNFIETANTFADWAAKKEHKDLATTIANAAADFQMIFDSPMDLDGNLLSVIWDQLRPSITGLRRVVTPAVVEAENTDENEKPDNSKTTTSPDSSATVEKHTPDTNREAKARFVRIREERLDEFLEHVSRLFITSELFKDIHARMACSGHLSTLVDEFRKINHSLKVESTALQSSVISLRRVSIAGLFSKFPRMARTLALKLDKKIMVHVSGEDTEIDKTLAKDLDAPLTHLIRNVVDHAIEMPEERRQRGVNETGNLWLTAEESKSHVRITVRDDGRGIDHRWIRDKAVEKKAVTREEADAMSDEEALRLIFHPGFSTAEKVSDISGRGVGMDVVRTTLAEHDGKVFVESEVGVGTTLRLEIPIRQATLVVNGLMVSEGGQEYVIPFEYIQEIDDIGSDAFGSVHGQPVVTIRQGTYDAISLSKILGLDKTNLDSTTEKTKKAATLLCCREGVFCLLVDRIVGHRQVVVTGLKNIVSNADKMAGVAQLGGGRLALVLNVPEIFKTL